MSAFEHFPRVRLEYQPFTRTETVDVDPFVIFFRQFFEKIMLIEFRLQIDVPLGALKRIEVPLYIFQSSIFVQQKAVVPNRDGSFQIC